MDSQYNNMKSITFVLLILFAGLQYKLWFDDGNLLELREKRQLLQVEQAHYQSELKNNQQLLVEIESLKQGGDILEEQARINLGLVKPGESYYHIIEK